MSKILRLASYNIRKCVGLDRRRNPARSLEVIKSLDGDIIALQEADRRLGKRPAALPRDLIKANSDFYPINLGETDISLGWHGNAVLLRKGLKAGTTLKLDLPGLEPRGAIITTVGNLRIIAVHLGLIRRYRTLQMQAITTALAEQPTMPTVIMGDFNEWSRTGGMAPLQRDFTVHSPGLTFHASRPVAALDRFAISHDLHLHTAGVLKSETAKRASDHLPVWADIVLP